MRNIRKISSHVRKMYMKTEACNKVQGV